MESTRRGGRAATLYPLAAEYWFAGKPEPVVVLKIGADSATIVDQRGHIRHEPIHRLRLRPGWDRGLLP